MKVLIIAFVIAITSSITLGWYAQKIRSGAPMVEGANRFLASLTAEKRAKASFGFNDEERLNWHFVPRVRKGLPLKEMSQSERDLAKALLKTGLQQKAFLKTEAIIGLELVLREIEKGSGPVRDPELYYVSIFGEPTLKGSWGWRFEGHHLALNFTVVNGTMIATAPSFFGSNPALVKEGPKKGLRILAAEEDLARSLVESLDEKQKSDHDIRQGGTARHHLCKQSSGGPAYSEGNCCRQYDSGTEEEAREPDQRISGQDAGRCCRRATW